MATASTGPAGRRGGARAVVLVTLLLASVATCARDDREPARPPDVEFVPSEVEVVDTMLALARVTKNDLIYDLGSGDGRILIAAAKRVGARGVGIDIDPLRIVESRRNADTAEVERLVEFREDDLFEVDLRPATVVTLYLLPELNARLRPKLLAELQPGARVVSHEFDMGDWPPDSSARALYSRIHLWTIPANVAGEWTVLATIDSVDHEYTMSLEQSFQRLTGVLIRRDRAPPISPARTDRPSTRQRRREIPIEPTAARGDRVALAFFDSSHLVLAGRATGDTLTGRVLRDDGADAGTWRAIRVRYR